jgi:hypothetical protein
MDNDPIKRRNRAQLTCDPCKQSKIKCDREQPTCGQVSVGLMRQTFATAWEISFVEELTEATV